MLKLHYLVITPFFPSKANFVGPYVLDQVKTIKELSSYEVTVLKPKPLFSKLQDYKFDGVAVHYFKRVVLPSNILPGLFKKLSSYFFLKKLKQLNIEVKQIEVVHSHVTENGFYANCLKTQNTKIKTIVQHHGFDVLSLESGKLSNWLWHRNWVKNYGISICNPIDLHIGVSDKTLSCVAAFSDIKMKSTYVLYNGVDSNKFYPIKGLKDRQIFKIGCIANFWPLKDQMTLIKAAHELTKQGMNNLNVVFIGTGTLLETCKKYVVKHQLQKQITFQKEVMHKELNTFYNTLDLFVLPSFHEAFGCVYTEAYACGVPFVGVKRQGIAELIPAADIDTWLIDKGDAVKLAEIILNFRTYKIKQKLLHNHEIKGLITLFLNKLETI